MRTTPWRIMATDLAESRTLESKVVGDGGVG